MATLTRLHLPPRAEDWPARLAAAIERARREPFAWGRQDCALFAADAVCALTGADPAEPFRGRYDDALSAARVLSELGGLYQAMTDLMGDPLPALQARRGDLVLWVQTESGETLGVCCGRQFAAPGPDGLVFVALDAALCAWRV